MSVGDFCKRLLGGLFSEFVESLKVSFVHFEVCLLLDLVAHAAENRTFA